MIRQRTCVGCRQAEDQSALIRFALVEGSLLPSPTGGRGVWLHPSEECLKMAKRRRGFSRSLRRQVADASVMLPPIPLGNAPS